MGCVISEKKKMNIQFYLHPDTIVSQQQKEG